MTQANASHPKDFGPVLDRRSGDVKAGAIEEHLRNCQTCSEVVREWRSFDALFRSSSLDLDVPAFQWERIRARIEAGGSRGAWLGRIWEWSQPRAYAFGLAASALLFALLTFAGLQYRGFVDSRDFADLRNYSRAERMQSDAGGNPFRAAVRGEPAGENPFTRFQIESKENPFVMH